jgi:hypothetical protein
MSGGISSRGKRPPGIVPDFHRNDHAMGMMPAPTACAPRWCVNIDKCTIIDIPNMFLVHGYVGWSGMLLAELMRSSV